MNMAEAAHMVEQFGGDGFDWKDAVFLFGFGSAVYVIIRGIVRQSRADKATSRIDLDDLVLDHRTNRLSDRKLFKAGAFVISSIVMIYMTIKLALTEWAFGLYMAAWVAEDVVTAAKGKLATPLPPADSSPQETK